MKITIRGYQESDAGSLASIYYHTIHNINTKDYSKEQVDAWAPMSSLEIEGWKKKWKRVVPLVAIADNTVVGFAEFESNGHIDCFYCHHEWLGKGVGSALMHALLDKADSSAIKKVFAEVSITAKPFFEAKGFLVVKEQIVEVRGVKLKNYVMELHFK